MTSEQDGLAKDAHDRIFIERILSEPNFTAATAHDRPRLVILGGQPGSGKGGLVRQARAELNGDAVTVDPDELRARHPLVDEFRRDNPYDWSSRTHHDASAWADELRLSAMAEKKNMIYDTTLSSGEWTLSVIEEAKVKGYEVEIRVVASPLLESELGVDKRFTDQLDAEGQGRYVPEGARDAIYKRIPASLNTIHEKSDVPIRIFNREGVQLYHSRTDSRLPGEVLEEARLARLKDPAVTQGLRNGWEEQARWHRDLPEHARDIPNTNAHTQMRLLEQHSDLKVGEGVLVRADSVATIDELVRTNAPRSHAPIVGLEVPKLSRATATLGLVGLGVAAAAYDAKETGERIGTALAQDNPTGAESEATRYAARGLGGAAAVLTPAATGIGGGPAVALAVADAYLLTQAFDRGAQYLDARKITHQTDRDGVQWEYTGRQWLRDDLKADLRFDAVAQENRQTFSALPDKARELNYLASVEAVSQAIGKADARNPFELPANANDAPSNQPSPWQLDAGSGAWQRTRYVDMDPSDARMPDRAVPETAGPERAAELDLQASQVIDENIKRGPAALAAQYQIGHKRNGFDQVGQEPMSVQTALNPDTLEASDGKQYARNAQGAWSEGGDPASGLRALELETTRQRLLPALEQHRTQLAAMPAWQPLTPEQQDRANLRQLYADHGVNPNAQRFEATYQAVQQARVAQGINAETTSLALEPRPIGAYDVDTPIQHLRIEGPSLVRVAATTTAADIARTETALQTAPAAPDSPGEQQRIATTARTATQGVAVGATPINAASEQRANQPVSTARGDTPPTSTPAVDTQAEMSLAMPRTPTAAANPLTVTPAQPVSGPSTGPTAAAAAQTAPVIDDIRQAAHPGNGGYRMLASRVDMFEKQNGIEHGPHSQRLAASLSALSTREQLDPQRLFLRRDERGAITLVQRTRAGEPESAEVRVPIDAQALGAQPIDVSSRAHAAALSHHYAVMGEHAQRREAQTRDAEARRGDDPRLEGRGMGERSNDAGLMHASANQDGRRIDGNDPRQRTAPDDTLAALTSNDRALFDRIRQNVPPTIPDAHVAQALLLGKQNHIAGAADVERVAVMGDRIVVLGNLQTGAARVDHDASQPAPALEATVQQTQSHNRQQDQNHMIAAQQIQQQGQGGYAR